MPHRETHPASLPADELLKQCRLRQTKRSGPGGQHRNKVETAIVLTHLPSGIIAEASERRSQAENRREATFRLRLRLALAIRRPPDAASAPSPLWRQRCRGSRISINPRHEDFPAMLAEALDFLEAAEMDVERAALRLDCTNSQLVKFLKHEPPALALVNTRRAELGLRRLQ